MSFRYSASGLGICFLFVCLFVFRNVKEKSFYIFLFIYLAVLGLSCSMQTRSVACGI